MNTEEEGKIVIRPTEPVYSRYPVCKSEMEMLAKRKLAGGKENPD